KDAQDAYKKIVGKETVTQQGLFIIHKNKSDFYFEVPLRLLGRDLLVVNKILKVPQALNEAGVNRGINYENRLVRFELDKEDKKLKIRSIEPMPDYPEEDVIGQSVRENFISPLIESLSVEAYNSDSSAVLVKVNDIYNGTETSINNVFNQINLGTSAIKNLSKVISAKPYENNVAVTSELTTKVTEGNSSIYITLEIISSLVLLPEKPMTGRFESNRIGYFTTSRIFFSDRQQQIEKHRLITRWRLEPKAEDIAAYRNGVLVEPVQPIVFYIDTSTPKQWRKYIKEGIESWQAAFERAGFKNAIFVRELPDSIRADSDDINYSVVTYVASPKINAMGPSICDPRSGEIIEADIIWWHNVLSMLQKWIIVQTGAANPAARTLPLQEEQMGEAIRFVACHEAGHSLGLRHNMMGSWAFPTDSLRSKTFTDLMKATSSSIMDYARYNYVAQPDDSVTHFAPNIGPYDLLAIEYGYRWTGNDRPEADADMLLNLLDRHSGRLYKYSEAQDSRNVIDPRAQSEDLGDDPVKSSRLGIANLKRIMPHLAEWTKTGEKGQSYEETGRLYAAVIAQWNNYLYHALANIGGIYMENITMDDEQKRYTFVEKEKQRDALRFLLKEALSNQQWLFGTPINQYVFPMQRTPDGYLENAPSLLLKNTQSYIFWDLLENKRLTRMLENENLNGENAFPVTELLESVHQHIFGVSEKGAIPNPSERSLQKGLVDALILSVSKENTSKEKKKLMDEYLSSSPQEVLCSCHAHDLQEPGKQALTKAPNFYSSYAERISDAISMKRGELLRIKDLLEKRQQTGDTASKYHYKDIILRINTALGIQ
ncbi:MAG: zinc-dependent metalloprotease, partial [Dysgonamonadaceae bacterium]|nr:zinc-dependent metalloprotease [Dysgonamonadaceae bacterium]